MAFLPATSCNFPTKPPLKEQKSESISNYLVGAFEGPLAPLGVPVWNPFLNFRATCLRYRIRPVPVVRRCFAFSPQLSIWPSHSHKGVKLSRRETKCCRGEKFKGLGEKGEGGRRAERTFTHFGGGITT